MNDDRPKVYLTQMNPAWNYYKAERYGELVPLVQRDAFPDDVDERVKTIAEIMKRKLADFNPLRDFILLTGDPIAMCLAVMAVNRRSMRVQVLKWDGENQDYFTAVLAL
jgi:hypothetical protein